MLQSKSKQRPYAGEPTGCIRCWRCISTAKFLVLILRILYAKARDAGYARSGVLQLAIVCNARNIFNVRSLVASHIALYVRAEAIAI
jgi:hypothetical protein